MASLDISFNRLKENLEKDLTIQEFENILFDFGLEIDDYNQEEDILKIDITAERVDLLSFNGLLRALRLYLAKDNPKEYQVTPKVEYVVNVSKSVNEYGNYTMCFVVDDILLDDLKIKELINIQEKLHLTYGRKRKSIAIGIYPKEQINFPIDFIAKDPKDIKFTPLNSDKEMDGEEIIENHPIGQKYKYLLKDKSKYLCFIDSDNKVLSMPPIVNSKDTGKITENTKQLFVECTGANLYKLEKAINILACLFIDMGGKINPITVKYSNKDILSPNLEFREKEINYNYINEIIGTNLKKEDIPMYLERMGYVCNGFNNDFIKIKIPSYRTDILHDNDICEDVARAYGYSNINLRYPSIFTISKKTKDSIKQDKIIESMISLGFLEAMPLLLTNKKESLEDFNIELKDSIPLGFSAESSLNLISSWWLPKLLKILKNNQHREFPQKLFVCDYISKRDETKLEKSSTILKTSAIISNSKVSFSEISSYLLSLLNNLGYDFKLQEKDYPFLLNKRSADIYIDSKKVGFIGELDPDILNKNKYYNPVVCFELEI